MYYIFKNIFLIVILILFWQILLIHCQNPYIKSCFSKKEVSRAPLCCPCIQEKEDDDDEGEENVILEISFL